MLHWQLEKKPVIVYRRDGRSNSPERQDEVQKECGKGSACSPGKPVPKLKCRNAAAWCYSTNCWMGLFRTEGENGDLDLRGFYWCDYCDMDIGHCDLNSDHINVIKFMRKHPSSWYLFKSVWTILTHLAE